MVILVLERLSLCRIAVLRTLGEDMKEDTPELAARAWRPRGQEESRGKLLIFSPRGLLASFSSINGLSVTVGGMDKTAPTPALLLQKLSGQIGHDKAIHNTAALSSELNLAGGFF